MKTARFARRILFLFALLVSASVLPGVAQTLDHFDFSAIASPKQTYAPFRFTITARSSTGARVTTYRGTVQLRAASGATPIQVESFGALTFSSGTCVATVAINEAAPDVSLIVTDPSTGRSGSSLAIQVNNGNYRVLELPIISIASDQLRGVLYASAGPTNGPSGIVYVVDPVVGDYTDAHFFDGGVERIELSDDASKLYVVTDNGSIIRRLRLPDFVEEAALALGESAPGSPNYVADLAVQPGHPDTIAVIKRRRGITPWFTGLSVFEDTTEKIMPNAFGADSGVIEWGSKPGRLYGWDNQTSPSKLNQYDLAATELSFVENRRNIFTLFNGDIHFSGGKLYSSTGRIADPETFTILGELQGGDPTAAIVPIPDRKRIVYFTPLSLGFMLTYDSDTLQFIGSEPFPMPRGYGSGAVFWGSNGIAFHDGKRLFLNENELIPSGPSTDLEVTVPISQVGPVDVGTDIEMQAIVRNLGPNESGPLLIKIAGTSDAVLTSGSVVGMNAVTTVSDREIDLRLNTLAANALAEVRFTAHSTNQAWTPLSVLASSSAVDPISTNNSAAIVLKSAPDAPLFFRMANTTTVSDRTRGIIYAAPSSALEPFGNTIVAIDPISGKVNQPVLVGSRPSQLAVSDDGKYLYVGFLGLPEVRRFLLPSLQLDLIIPLGADGFVGPRFAGPIDIRPGYPAEFAVARSNGTGTSAPYDLFGYFRDATEFTPDRGNPTMVRFGGPDRIYAYEDSWGVFRFDVADAGLTWVKILPNVEQYLGQPFAYSNGKFYFSDGPVFDAETGSQLGSFNMFGPFGPSPIVDETSGHVFLAQRTATNCIVSAFNSADYSFMGSNTVAGVFGNINGLCRWAADGIAVSGSSAIAAFKSEFLPTAPTDLRVVGVSIATGNSIAFQFSDLSPGQYVIQQCESLGSTWTSAGDPFTETTPTVSIPLSGTQKFFRLVRLP